MRLIDADELQEQLAQMRILDILSEWEYETLSKIVTMQETVEQKRHGKWERSEDDFYPLVKCTACGEEFVCTELDIIEDLKWNYCPNCGAKMDK